MTSRRYFAHEVVQTSNMDCGPAALKCLLEGYGISTSYGRLREACQTDVDGTSIDTIEEVAVELGLEAEQTLVPKDHVGLPGADQLPAIAVIQQPGGLTHFVVVWRQHRKRFQVMDPGMGRLWPTHQQFRSQLYEHKMQVSAQDWREWAHTEEFLQPLEVHMKKIGVRAKVAQKMIFVAGGDPSWRPTATLDAAVRLVSSLIQNKVLKPGRQAEQLLASLVESVMADESEWSSMIPPVYWSAMPIQDQDQVDPQDEQIMIKGAVLVQVAGRKEREHGEEQASSVPLRPELQSALTEPKLRPGRTLLGFLRQEGVLAPSFLFLALLASALIGVVQVVIFRGFLDLSFVIKTPEHRILGLLAFAVLVGLMLALEIPIYQTMFAMGRRLEAGLRIAFFEKLPRISDRYFRSRLVSDMAERCHSIDALHSLPELAGQFIRLLFLLLLTALGIIWIDPALAVLVGIVVVVSIGLPLALQPALAERDLRLRSHLGALTRYYLDSLLGLLALRSHRAERPMFAQHDETLAEWSKAGLSLLRFQVSAEAVIRLVGFASAILLLYSHLSRTQHTSSVLLLVFWALQLPAFASELAALTMRYPSLRSRTLRLLEPLGAFEQALEDPDEQPGAAASDSQSDQAGLGISMCNVSVKVPGLTVLRDLSLEIRPGEHVAIVGPSGAGKSSFVGLLLGWHQPATGDLLVDGRPNTGANLRRTRMQAAWVDPSIQLWNRSLLYNLCYGSTHSKLVPAEQLLRDANLHSLLQTLENGLQTDLGESGCLVSGGEGQRVRLGRAMARSDARLVILDEPFRGLQGSQRKQLMERTRRLWQQATLLCITHDVVETLSFARVLVVVDGTIVEDGDPQALAQAQDSHYARMLQAQKAIQKLLLDGSQLRRLKLEEGKLVPADTRMDG